jgi:protein phosphatase PTC2/3
LFDFLSRCVLYQNGTVVPLSVDQKPTDNQEKKRILESGNIVLLGRVNGSLAVSRAFGDFRYKKSKEDQELTPDKFAVTVVPEIKRQTFSSGDSLNFLVLACDGVWDVMNNEEVCQFIVEELKKQKEAENFSKYDLGSITDALLVKCIEDLRSSDNCTVIIVLFK